jgi:antitoxin (DNA-binding transcriptional repressor) of toxin-antitoxin stability system
MMQTETIDIEQAQAHFRDLLHRVVAGVHVVLCENQKTIAHLVPAGERVAGLHSGAIWASEDFDAPLPECFWTDNK